MPFLSRSALCVHITCVHHHHPQTQQLTTASNFDGAGAAYRILIGQHQRYSCVSVALTAGGLQCTGRHGPQGRRQGKRIQ
jgi:hypothetical protein